MKGVVVVESKRIIRNAFICCCFVIYDSPSYCYAIVDDNIFSVFISDIYKIIFPFKSIHILDIIPQISSCELPLFIS